MSHPCREGEDSVPISVGGVGVLPCPGTPGPFLIDAGTPPMNLGTLELT